jgi:hypothetical protein
MIEGVSLIAVPGRDLHPKDVDSINEARLQVFGSNSKPISPRSNPEEARKAYFLAKKGQVLLAFGRIHEVRLGFMDQEYNILGTATLVSVVKGHGFGRMVASAMTDYVKSTGKTSVGFNEKRLSPMYKECGREILPDGVERFAAPEPPKYPDDDVNYIRGKDGLISKMLEHPDEVARLSRAHW